MSRDVSPLKTIKIDDRIVVFVTRENKNKLIDRLEIEARIEHVGVGTPSRETVREVLAKTYSVDKDLVVIRRIDTTYGRGSSKVIARIYRSREELEKYESEHLLKRGVSGKT